MLLKCESIQGSWWVCKTMRLLGGELKICVGRLTCGRQFVTKTGVYFSQGWYDMIIKSDTKTLKTDKKGDDSDPQLKKAKTAALHHHIKEIYAKLSMKKMGWFWCRMEDKNKMYLLHHNEEKKEVIKEKMARNKKNTSMACLDKPAKKNTETGHNTGEQFL